MELMDRDELAQHLLDLHERLTWREIADHYGVTGGVVFRIAKTDYEPKKNSIRQKLGLPLVCQKCGEEVT